MNPKTKIILTAVLGLAWAGSAVFGARALIKYETQPGKIGQLSSAWPSGSAIEMAKDRPTLVMFAHPQCPCTRASISELAQVMAHVRDKVRAYVFFYTPRETESEWRDSNSRRQAVQIPGVVVLSDFDGAQAARFGAETSGHSFLFDPTGHLIFNGGITASRGHVGDNAGADAIVSLIDKHVAGPAKTFVFGCSIAGRNRNKVPCLK